jgi:L-serine dehydratase
MREKSSVFDMIGPVMIGPSSSHTAGVVRIARAAIKLLGFLPTEAEITFYNSFARTYEGHGSDLAVVAGLMDMKTDDKEIKHSFEVVGESLGGGIINIAQVNGFKADFSTNLHSLVITAEDVKGSIAFIADVVAHDDCNIATMSVSRKGKNDLACLVIEMDSGLKPVTLEYLKSLNWVKNLIYIPDIDR